MPNIEDILKTARERARKMGLPYAGTLTPHEAFQFWQEVNGAQLADVRTHEGFRECYNVLEGFEGDRDASGHRNTVGGWRAAGLPWVQS